MDSEEEGVCQSPSAEMPPDPVVLARIEKTSLQKLDVARSLVTSANRAFLLFSVSLALLWVQRVFPLFGSLEIVGRAQAEFMNKRGVTLERDWQGKLSTIQDAPWELFGFKLPVPAFYAPLVWASLCFILLAYVNFCRRRHFSLIGRSLRSLREDVGYSASALLDLCPALPWWLAPLPIRDGPVVTSDDLYRAFGWLVNRRRIIAFSYIALMLLVLVQLITLYVSWRTSLLIALRSKVEQFCMLEATALLAVLTALVALDWLRPARVTDNRITEISPNHLGRREFVGSSTLAFLSVLPYPANNLVRSYRARPKRAGSPRYIPKGKPVVTVPVAATKAKATGLLNVKSGVIHHISTGSTDQPCLYGIESKALEKMTPVVLVSSEMQGRNHIHGDHESWIAQREATKALSMKNPILATEVIFKSIQRRRSDLRLYDMLASITVQYQLPQQRERLIQIAQEQIALARISAPYAADLERPPQTSVLSDMIYRLLGKVDSARVRRRKHRSRCRDSQLVVRPRKGASKTSYAELLQRRVNNWKDPSGKWYKKWSTGKREWHEPVHAARCGLH